MVVKRVDGKEGVTENVVEAAPQAGVVVVVDPLLNVATDVDVGLVHDPGLGQGLAIADVKRFPDSTVILNYFLNLSCEME